MSHSIRYFLVDAQHGEAAEAWLAADELVSETSVQPLRDQLRHLNARKASTTWHKIDWKSFLRYYARTEANARSPVRLTLQSKCWRMAIMPNPWRVPNLADARAGILEGAPSQEAMAVIEAQVAHEQAMWQPSTQAWDLLNDLRAAEASLVRIQLWDPIMILLEEEGPFPFRAQVEGIATRSDARGFTQAYLHLKNVVAEPTPDGYDPTSSFEPHAEGGHWLNVDRLSTIEVLSPA